MKTIHIFFIISLWPSLVYCINKEDFFAFQQSIGTLAAIDKNMPLNPEALLSGISYPFVQALNIETIKQVAQKDTLRIQDAIDDRIIKNALTTYPTSLQISFGDTITKIKKELAKLPRPEFDSFIETLSSILQEFKNDFFIDPQVTSDAILQTKLKSYIEKLKKEAQHSYNNSLYKTVIKIDLDSFVQTLSAFTIRKTDRSNLINSINDIILQRNDLIKAEKNKQYISFIEETIKNYVLAPYATKSDAESYYSLKDFITRNSFDTKPEIAQLIDSILSIRITLIQKLQKLYYAYQETSNALSKNPEFKDKLVLLSTEIEKTKAQAKIIIEKLSTTALPEWDAIKQQWLELKNYPPVTGQTKVNEEIALEIEGLNKIQNILNLIFTLYLNPEVIKEKVGEDYFTSSIQRAMLKIINGSLKDYSEKIKTLKALGNAPKDLTSTYEAFTNILSSIKTEATKSLIIPHLNVFGLNYGDDIEDDVDWNKLELKAIKDLNEFIVENFNPVDNKFAKKSSAAFQKLYTAYKNSKNTNKFYDDSYKKWEKAALES